MKKTDMREMLEVEEIKFSDAYAMVKSNKIVDKKTISGILYYNEFSTGRGSRFKFFGKK